MKIICKTSVNHLFTYPLSYVFITKDTVKNIYYLGLETNKVWIHLKVIQSDKRDSPMTETMNMQVKKRHTVFEVTTYLQLQRTI